MCFCPFMLPNIKYKDCFRLVVFFEKKTFGIYDYSGIQSCLLTSPALLNRLSYLQMCSRFLWFYLDHVILFMFTQNRVASPAHLFFVVSDVTRKKIRLLDLNFRVLIFIHNLNYFPA